MAWRSGTSPAAGLVGGGGSPSAGSGGGKGKGVGGASAASASSSASAGGGAVEREFRFPAELAGHVYGRGYKNVVRIRDETGAKLHVISPGELQADDRGRNTVVKVAGSASAVEGALAELEHLVSLHGSRSTGRVARKSPARRSGTDTPEKRASSPDESPAAWRGAGEEVDGDASSDADTGDEGSASIPRRAASPAAGSVDSGAPLGLRGLERARPHSLGAAPLAPEAPLRANSPAVLSNPARPSAPSPSPPSGLPRVAPAPTHQSPPATMPLPSPIAAESPTSLGVGARTQRVPVAPLHDTAAPAAHVLGAGVPSSALSGWRGAQFERAHLLVDGTALAAHAAHAPLDIGSVVALATAGRERGLGLVTAGPEAVDMAATWGVHVAAPTPASPAAPWAADVLAKVATDLLALAPAPAASGPSGPSGHPPAPSSTAPSSSSAQYWTHVLSESLRGSKAVAQAPVSYASVAWHGSRAAAAAAASQAAQVSVAKQDVLVCVVWDVSESAKAWLTGVVGAALRLAPHWRVEVWSWTPVDVAVLVEWDRMRPQSHASALLSFHSLSGMSRFLLDTEGPTVDELEDAKSDASSGGGGFLTAATTTPTNMHPSPSLHHAPSTTTSTATATSSTTTAVGAFALAQHQHQQQHFARAPYAAAAAASSSPSSISATSSSSAPASSSSSSSTTTSASAASSLHYPASASASSSSLLAPATGGWGKSAIRPPLPAPSAGGSSSLPPGIVSASASASASPLPPSHHHQLAFPHHHAPYAQFAAQPHLPHPQHPQHPQHAQPQQQHQLLQPPQQPQHMHSAAHHHHHLHHHVLPAVHPGPHAGAVGAHPPHHHAHATYAVPHMYVEPTSAALSSAGASAGSLAGAAGSLSSSSSSSSSTTSPGGAFVPELDSLAFLREALGADTIGALDAPASSSHALPTSLAHIVGAADGGAAPSPGPAGSNAGHAGGASGSMAGAPPAGLWSSAIFSFPMTD